MEETTEFSIFHFAFCILGFAFFIVPDVFPRLCGYCVKGQGTGTIFVR
jgi:hypothetical protein